MRVRTINEAAAYFQELDPGTALTKTAIRRLVTTGTIPSTRIGNKYLVDVDQVAIYLQGRNATSSPLHGVIRRIG